jgi:tripartite-type tricarboxylate transporter receptor subunit TctC
MAGAFRIALVLALVGTVASARDGTAQESVSYKGKTVALIINSAAGGGTDLINRMIGTYLVKYLPGEPHITFRNIVGGGGIKANNYFASQVPPDGMTFIGGSRSNISPTKVRAPQVKYDPAKYQFIGGDANLGTVMVVRSEVVERLTDTTKPPVVYGDLDGTRSGTLLSLWAKETLGWNLRWVVGYPGNTALSTAVQSGELDSVAIGPIARLQPMLASGAFVAVAQFGSRDDSGKMVPRASFPDVPLFSDLILPKLEGAARTAFLSFQTDSLVNKWVALPPGTPTAHVAAYRAAYQKVVRDPAFLKYAESDIGAEYTPVSGEQLQAIVEELGATSDEDLQFIKVMAKKYGVQQVN